LFHLGIPHAFVLGDAHQVLTSRHRVGEIRSRWRMARRAATTSP
jgi:hypothetical protein